MTIELKLWQFVLVLLAAFECGLFFMAWWAYREEPEFPLEDIQGTDADTAEYMMGGKL